MEIQFDQGGDEPNCWRFERDVQHRDEKQLVAYWKSIGGREEYLGVKMRHLYKIIGHDSSPPEGRYQVHWMGHTAEDATWEKKSAIQPRWPMRAEIYEQKIKAGAPVQ